MSIRTVALTLAPTEAQCTAFVRLRHAFVAACNDASAVAWEQREFNRVRLHHLAYNGLNGARTIALLGQSVMLARGPWPSCSLAGRPQGS